MRSSRGRLLLPACGAGLAAALLLTACTAAAPRPVGTPRVESAAPAAARTEAPATPEATSNPSFLRDPDTAPWGVVTVAGESLVGHYTNFVYPVQVPRDGGAIEYARGTPIAEGSRIVAYRVASGDIYDYIAKRFHLTNDGYLLILNESRRGEAADLFTGDVLNLSASTLDKYGSVNGRVVRGPRPITAPSQEP